jgi:hypothetical protein
MEVCAGVQDVASRILNLKEKSLETEYYDSNGGVERIKVVQRKGRNNTSTINDDDGLIDQQNMINAEKEMVTRVKNLQIENLDFVRTRRRDEDGLRKAFFTSDHDVVTSKTPTLMARKNDQEQTCLDYLSPYLFYVKDVHNITTEEAMMVYKLCTKTLEDRMLERANIIQNRLNEENERLAQCQASYQQRLLQIDGQSEQDFEQLCSEITFTIKILGGRLHDHEESSLDKLKKLELKLKGDERLNSLKAQTSDAPLK